MTDQYKSDIEQVVQEVIDENKHDWHDYQNGEDGALNYLIGQAMQKVRGRVNPSKFHSAFESVDTDTDR